MKRSLITPIAAMISLAVLAMTTPAHADLEIALQETGVNGGAITVVATGSSFSSTSFSGTYGDFVISILGGASNDSATLSDLLSSTTSVKNTSGSAKTLHLYVSQTDYTLPTGSPLSIESGLGGTVDVGILGPIGIFQAYADKNNNLFGITDFTNGPQNDTALGSTFDTGSAVGLFSRTGDYSLTSATNLTLSGGGIANYSNHINATATPEPSTMALSVLGALGLIVYFMRRRKTVCA